MYCVSCCAALEVLKYSPEETRDEVREHVEKCQSADATVGVTNFVDLRSICVTVRQEEAHITKFRGCTLHPMCGIVDGEEFSAMQIGGAVRRMHDAVRSKMFSQMLKDKALPDGFRDKVDKMVDNMDEEKVGYWGAVRSAERVLCSGMLGMDENASSARNVCCRYRESGAKSAVDILKELLTSMHLPAVVRDVGQRLGRCDTEHANETPSALLSSTRSNDIAQL